MSSALLNAAIGWASMGIPVFPVRGKIPRTRHGVKDASTDEARIEAWWGEAPAAGIGGATGEPCGYWVLDVDGDEGRASLAQLEQTHGNLPETLTCRTGGGGEHRWFRMPEDRPVGNRASVRPSLDVRGTGGYVVLPPSPHPSGGSYEVVLEAPIVDAPAWLLDLVAPKRKATQAQTSIEHARIAGMVRAACERIRAAPEGSRNDTVNRECYAVGGFLRAAGMLPEQVESELQAAAEAADQPAETASRALRDGYDAPRALPPSDRPDNRPPEPGKLRNTEPDPDVWPELQVRRNEEKGTEAVLPSLPNAITILDADRRWRDRVRLCEFRGRVELDGQVVRDSDEAEVVVWMARAYGCNMAVTTVHDALGAVAARNPRHPIREYLLGLRWDGTARLDTWLERYAGVNPHPDGLNALYGAKFLISAVARILAPGCQVDQVLVLSDPMQGRGKTSLVRTLAGLENASDTQLQVGEKDAYMQLQGVWIYELGELSALKRSDIEAVKNFVTARIDRFRPPYGRNVIERPRQCVFLGTTNEGRFLPEGGRRWWVRRVSRAADLVGLARDRDQLWAEAVYRYHTQEPWHLTAEEAERQREDAEQYVQLDPWTPLVEEYLTRHPVVTTAMVLAHLGVGADRRTRADEVRVGKVLEGLGLTSSKETVDGHRAWWWRRR